MAVAIATFGICLGFLFAREQWVYGLGLVVFALVLLWPVEATLGAYAFLLPFDSISRLGSSPEARALTWYVGAGVSLVLLILGVTNHKLRTPPRTSWYWFGFIGWGAISLFWALDSNMVVAELPTALGLLGLYLVSVCFDISEKQFSGITFLAIAGGTAASLVSLWDFHQGIWTIETRASLIAGSQHADPNVFAASLLIALTLGVSRLVSSRRFFEKLFMLLAVFATTAAIMLTMSRGALVALIFVVLIFAYRLKRNPWILFFFALLPLSTLVLPSLFFVRLKEALVTGGAGRLDIWVVGATAFKHFFAQGAGLENFTVAFEQFRQAAPIFRGYSRPAHNIYLQVAVELGIVGICLLGAAVFSQLRALYRAISFSRPSRRHATLVGCEAMIWSMLAAAFFVGMLWEKTFWIVWMISAMAVHTAPRSVPGIEPIRPVRLALPVRNTHLLPQPCFETE